MEKLHDFLINAESTDVFNIKWKEWVLKYKLENNKWLQNLFAIRLKWCPPFMTNYFFIGMSTTQISEAMNNLVKVHIKSSFTLYEFIGSLETILMRVRDKEILKDHEDTYTPPHLITNLVIEDVFLNKYTYEAFAIYQNQVRLSMNYFIYAGTNTTLCFFLF